MPGRQSPNAWLDLHCPSLDGQFLFLDPVWWDTHLLSEGAVKVLREAAAAIEVERFNDFLQEVEAAGGWPPELERLAHALASLASETPRRGHSA